MPQVRFMIQGGKYRIGRVLIRITNPVEAQKSISELATSGIGGFICFSNVRMVRYANKHQEYAKLMNDSLMNLPDGTPLTWCAKIWGIKGVQCTPGPTLFKIFMQSAEGDLHHFLLGDTDITLNEIVKRYQTANHHIVGTYSLPFVDVQDYDYDGIVKMIEDSGSNLVWTAMRAPKQDEFNARISKLLPHVVFVGVGRAFRTSIGEFKEVPVWAQRMGLSGFWLSRGSFWEESKFYSGAILALIKYIAQIIWWRMNGRKCDE